MRKRSHWPLFATLFAMNIAFYTGCSEENKGGANGGAGGTDESQAGAGSTESGGQSPAKGGANTGGRSGGKAGAQARGGSTQAQGGSGSTQTQGGATQTQGGATQTQGGSTQAQGGTTQGVGGAAQGGTSTGVAGASSTSTEPCVGELINDVCVPLAPFALVQSAKRTAGSAAPTDVVKLSADSKSGNLLVLGVGVIWNAAAQTITVPPGFTLIERRDNSTTTAHETAALYVSENAPAFAAATGVTVTVADSQARQYLVLAEYAGLLSSGALDQKASQAGTGVLSTGTTAITTMDNELWLAITASRGGNAHTDPTNGFAFVQQMTTGAGAFSLTARLTTQRGTATTSVTGSGDYAAVVATFRRSQLQ